MIYTIGDRRNYLAAIAREGTIQKTGKYGPCDRFPNGYPGGYAFLTVEAAREAIEAIPHRGVWAVFGIDADWETDTEPSEDGPWHHLLRDADIVVLEGVT